MRLRIVLATVAAVAFVVPAVAVARTTGKRVNGDRDCTSRLFRTVAQDVYQPWYRGLERRERLARLRRCAPNQATLDHMLRIQHNLLAGRRQAITAYERLTPYGGPGRTRWAIPYSIVACESGGSWGAADPSGAIGPYQLLGWGAPWPVAGWRDKMQHRRIASRVWAGGAGRGNWVC